MLSQESLTKKKQVSQEIYTKTFFPSKYLVFMGRYMCKGNRV
jgi:hypothetical protein